MICEHLGKAPRKETEASSTSTADKTAVIADLRIKDEACPGSLAVIGIDPGVYNTVTAALTYLDAHGVERVKTWTLTRKNYYARSGVAAAQDRKRRRDAAAGLPKLWAGVEQAGQIRSADVAQVAAYLEASNAAMEQWWPAASRVVHSRERIRTMQGRRRVLDAFFHDMKREAQELVGEGVEVVVAYGAAKFSPSGRGRPTTPTTSVFKACARHLRTHTQCECRTSRQHHRCFGDVQPCWHSHVSADIKVDDAGTVHLSIDATHGAFGAKVPECCWALRGLQYCPMCDRLLNRDKNSAQCIAKVFRTVRVRGQPVPKAFKPRADPGKKAAKGTQQRRRNEAAPSTEQGSRRYTASRFTIGATDNDSVEMGGRRCPI
jgi:hypothetical protein